MKVQLGAGALCLFLMACQVSHSEEQQAEKANSKKSDKVQQKVIYGDDNRIDFYEIRNPDWVKAAQATVALIDGYKVVEHSDHYTIDSQNIGSIYNLCRDEPFFDQPTAAFCSGSLIGPDIVVTAGHCINDQFDCNQSKFVFNFAYQQAGQHPQKVDKEDVYSCSKVIHSEVVGFRGSDFAIISLDRPVKGRTPLKVRQSGVIDDVQELTVIGHPSGLPTKFADGAKVRNNLSADYFVANLDTYGGNSGSAVFNNTTKEVEGILVRGEADYVLSGGCRKSNRCGDNECRGEDVTRITKIFDHLAPDDLVSTPDPQPEALPKAKANPNAGLSSEQADEKS